LVQLRIAPQNPKTPECDILRAININILNTNLKKCSR